MKLYFSPGACSLSCHISLREADLAFDLEKVNIHGDHTTAVGKDYYAVNPKGYVPALALDSGEVLTENAAIHQYIADQRPEKHLAPLAGTMARLRLQEWLHFTGTELHKTFGPLFRKDAPEATKQSARELLAKRFAYVDKQLEGNAYLLGYEFTVADAYLYVMLVWADHNKLDLPPGLRAYKDRITARPAVQAALDVEQSARD